LDSEKKNDYLFSDNSWGEPDITWCATDSGCRHFVKLSQAKAAAKSGNPDPDQNMQAAGQIVY
jgi:hypothetical protein